MADKYGLSKDAIARKAKAQHWDKDRATVSDKAATLVIQKTARAVASNAAKLEQAKSLALDWVIAVLQSLPPGNTGSRIRQAWTDSKGKYNAIDLNMQDVISAISKLETCEAPAETETMKRAREILGGVKNAID